MYRVPSDFEPASFEDILDTLDSMDEPAPAVTNQVTVHPVTVADTSKLEREGVPCWPGADWHAYKDQETGQAGSLLGHTMKAHVCLFLKVYYFNHITRMTQWDRPRQPSPPTAQTNVSETPKQQEPPAAKADESLSRSESESSSKPCWPGSVWIECKSEESPAPYFYNTITKGSLCIQTRPATFLDQSFA